MASLTRQEFCAWQGPIKAFNWKELGTSLSTRFKIKAKHSYDICWDVQQNSNLSPRWLLDAFSELMSIKFKQQNPPLYQVCSASLQAANSGGACLGPQENPSDSFLSLPINKLLYRLALLSGQSEALICKGHLSPLVVCKAWSLPLSETEMKGRSFSVLTFPVSPIFFICNFLLSCDLCVCD